MKTLLIMRHAKSSWADPSLVDHDRPLNQRGKADAPRMGKLIKQLDLVPDLILCSSATRAVETANEVVKSSGYDGQPQIIPALYHAGPDDYLDVLGQLPDEIKTALIIGHNPGLEEFLDELTGTWERMPTGALAQVSLLIKDWPDLFDGVDGELENIWLPRALR